MNSNEELLQLLKQLKSDGLIQIFCKNEHKDYIGNYNNSYLSRILNDKLPYRYSLNYTERIIHDIGLFYKGRVKREKKSTK